MRNTRAACAAYDGDMEILIFALLLFMSDERSDLKHTLENFLAFYRENRELISIITSSAKAEEQKTDPIPPKCEKPQGEGQEKPRPFEGAGNASVLEEFLKRRG